MDVYGKVVFTRPDSIFAQKNLQALTVWLRPVENQARKTEQNMDGLSSPEVPLAFNDYSIWFLQL